jgi:hypothetical protein
MNELDNFDQAMHAAVDALTDEQRRVFSNEFHAQFPETESTASNGPSTAMERAWRIASSKLLSDPLDPIGDAWARFTMVLFTQ